METTEIIEYLTRYQAWRRGEDDRTMCEAGIEPAELGRVIDAAIGALGDHIPDATKKAQGNLILVGDITDASGIEVPKALVVQFGDYESLRAAVDAGQCRFTVFGG